MYFGDVLEKGGHFKHHLFVRLGLQIVHSMAAMWADDAQHTTEEWFAAKVEGFEGIRHTAVATIAGTQTRLGLCSG